MSQIIADTIKDRDLSEVTKERYLHYAMSVVKGRALPDVRDGLKPVQRRVLYAMYEDLSLTSDKPHRKSATVVGEVLGSYHAHGDASTYGTLVRMAQPFSTHHPLVDGYGNFGSIDGDEAAAYRYTECRLTSIASETMADLDADTVEMQDNFDNTTKEPEVLPTRVPLLLVNGSIGIAVGMSTSIPPHSLENVCNAVIDLVRHPNRRISTIVKNELKGPDFPTGGTIVDDLDEVTSIYEEGSGSVTLRASWTVEDGGRSGDNIVFTELPYQLNKEKVVENIAEHILDDELPQVKDVRDESTEDIRLVIDLKRGAPVDAVLAYLFKETDLQTRFHVNLTCLKPEGGKTVPRQMNLKDILNEYIDFRMDVIRRRLEDELDDLNRRIHILKGYDIVFEHTDKAVNIIQSCQKRSEAKDKLHDEFGLDEKQASSVLSSRIYSLMQGERKKVQEELDDKTSRRDRIQSLLSDKDKREQLLINELKRIKKEYGRDRRTSIYNDPPDYQYDEAMFIEKEDVKLVVTDQGWVSHQKSYSSLDKIRTKDHDEPKWVLDTDTKHTALFFTNRGRVYTERINELPSTTGYGEPVQTLFDFSNGEHVVSVITSDAFDTEGRVVAISTEGKGVRVDPSRFEQPSKVTGRRFMKVSDSQEVVNVSLVVNKDAPLALATENGRINVIDTEDVSFMKSVAKGVDCILLEDDDRVLAAQTIDDREGRLMLETSNGAERKITENTYDLSGRRTKGKWVIKRGSLEAWHKQTIEIE
jgi:DNA gyrase subunit A